MKIEILSDETIIDLIIASSKELLKNPHFTDSYTVLTAFEATIKWLYNHGKACKLIASNVDLKRFRASIYSYLRHGIDIHNSVRLSASSFYRNTRRSSEHDLIFIEELLAAEAERTEAIHKNEKETEAIRKILGHQSIGCIDKIEPLLTYGKNHGGIDIITYMRLFNYGYILGKRAERARRKSGAL
ncbi:MAG TPA: hypothetical protein RWO09_03120 [Ruminococcus sp.]